MNSGYDKFFKDARKQRGAQAAPIKPQQKKLSAQEIDQILRSQTRVKKSTRKNKFPWALTLFSAFGVCVAALALFKTDEIESFASKVEINWFASAHAEGKSSSAEKAVSGAEQPAAVVKKEAPLVDLDHLSKLNERKKSLDEREVEIARQETELATLKAELEKRLAELEGMRTKISEMLADRVKVDEQKLETLVQMYSNMKPVQAAKIFETLDEDLAIEILGKMKKKNAADVLNLVKADKAQIFSERYAGYKRK
jgi:flagellar motility protein MotE (MotC chaperone)